MNEIFDRFDDLLAIDRLGYRFENHRSNHSLRLPNDYVRFASKSHRYLPSNWELFSFFGHSVRGLDQMQLELIAEVDRLEWIAFGVMGDEDALLFNRRNGVSTVYTCDLESLGDERRYSSCGETFTAFIGFVGKSIAKKHADVAAEFLAASL